MSSAGYTLEVIEGADSGRTVRLDTPLEIGRDQGLGLVLDDPQASRRHARVTLGEAGPVVEDLGSSNGTFVNDQPVERSRRLVPGDHLLIGTTVVQVHDARYAGSVSGVRAVPPVTALGVDVLEPSHSGHSATEPDPHPSFRAPEGEPGYVPSAQASPVGRDYEAVAALADGRLKRQTSVAAFGFLSIAALAVIAYFGAA